MANIMTNALECQVQFLVEQRTEPYQEYGEGAAQTKIVHDAKNDWQKRALLVLERRGA